MLLAYASGATISSIARNLSTNRQKVGRCVDKALELGALAALQDLPRSGRPAQIPPEARAWVLACQKPKDLGYAEELWTMKLLAQHVQQHCEGANHSSLSKLAPGTEDSCTAGDPSPQNIVLPRTAGSRLRQEDG